LKKKKKFGFVSVKKQRHLLFAMEVINNKALVKRR